MEIISQEIPELIVNEELNITRVCELLLYVISRTATGMQVLLLSSIILVTNFLFWGGGIGPSAAIFESVISLDMMKVGRAAQMTRQAILAPVIGILLSLHRTALSADRDDTTGTGTIIHATMIHQLKWVVFFLYRDDQVQNITQSILYWQRSSLQLMLWNMLSVFLGVTVRKS